MDGVNHFWKSANKLLGGKGEKCMRNFDSSAASAGHFLLNTDLECQFFVTVLIVGFLIISLSATFPPESVNRGGLTRDLSIRESKRPKEP